MKVVKSIALTNDESLNKHLLTCHEMTAELSHELLWSYKMGSITYEELIEICEIFEVKRFARQYPLTIAKNFIEAYIYRDEFLHSEHASVRAEFARLGYRLDIFIHDESAVVRKVVADMKYGLSQLIFDSDENVRLTAMQHLKKIRHIDENNELLGYENSLEYHRKLLSERSDE